MNRHVRGYAIAAVAFFAVGGREPDRHVGNGLTRGVQGSTPNHASERVESVASHLLTLGRTERLNPL